MVELRIRDVRMGDAPGLADALREWGREYAQIDVDAFRVPDAEGLVEWFEGQLREDRDDDVLWLVAERERDLIGYIQAQVWRPSPDAGRQIMRDASETLLKIDALMVTATVVISSAHSPTAVPFYEDRMGYARTTIGFSKRL